MCALICTFRPLILEFYNFVVVSVCFCYSSLKRLHYTALRNQWKRNSSWKQNLQFMVGFFSRYLYIYLCLIMRCSLMKYNVLIFFLVFPFKSCLDRKLQVMCLDLFSSRLQNRHTDLPLVRLLEVSHGWAKEYSSSLFRFFLLLPFFPFCLSFKCGRLLIFSLGAVSKGWVDYKIEGEGVIWSTRVLEFTSYWSLQMVLLFHLWPNQFQKNQINSDVGPGSAFG